MEAALLRDLWREYLPNDHVAKHAILWVRKPMRRTFAHRQWHASTSTHPGDGRLEQTDQHEKSMIHRHIPLYLVPYKIENAPVCRGRVFCSRSPFGLMQVKVIANKSRLYSGAPDFTGPRGPLERPFTDTQ
jgi:hypothetical protein